MVVKWIRSRTEKRAAPVAQHCTGCRVSIPGASDEELRASGGVFLERVGWFCGPRCESQYRLRFRIQPPGTLTPSPQRAVTPPPAQAVAPQEPPRRSAADELAAAIIARRKRLSNGV